MAAKKKAAADTGDIGDVDTSPATAEVVHGHVTVKGTEGGGRRLYQTNPNTKEWLTEKEAKSQGFYWAD